MDGTTLGRKFEAIGARLRVTENVARLRDGSFEIDIDDARDGEAFLLRTAGRIADVHLRVLDIRPAERHLLLLGDLREPKADWRRLLCGHDERHWFVAATARASTIDQAKEALKPQAVRWPERGVGLRRKDRHRRRNDAWVRQGEWFFVPALDVKVEPWLVLKKEPLRRSNGSKPHVVDELFRTGGERVWVSPSHPAGMDERSYRMLLRKQPELAGAGWRMMMRNPVVVVRGRVRHPDHATIVLDGWHRVHMNGEVFVRQVAFLD